VTGANTIILSYTPHKGKLSAFLLTRGYARFFFLSIYYINLFD